MTIADTAEHQIVQDGLWGNATLLEVLADYSFMTAQIFEAEGGNGAWVLNGIHWASIDLINMLKRGKLISAKKSRMRSFSKKFGLPEDFTIGADFGQDDQPAKCGNPSCSLRSDMKQSGNKACTCRLVLYCNSACQKSHWKQHKPVCKLALQRDVSGSFFPDTQVLLGLPDPNESPLGSGEHKHRSSELAPALSLRSVRPLAPAELHDDEPASDMRHLPVQITLVRWAWSGLKAIVSRMCVVF